ncbi:ABC transporter ATP-binding protein [Flavobacteriales bacterium]|nr:ABC transporter ATP-binding protein [Flavobacteriales bacterium]
MDKESLAIQVVDITKKYGDDEVLSSVSFSVPKGETVGIIGPNGAGKTTLLKILSEVVSPTAGRAVINGSVASILEIGMGFHPDLSGTENVFFAGQMMGFSSDEVRDKIDEIVVFSELEEHMAKAVKSYSSGMYLRLAFSIFAMFDTDVLLLDEVLSVGDASFRRKSFEWMRGYKSKQKTILLVSHNLKEVEGFCDRIIYIDRLLKTDSYNPRSVILEYIRDYPTEPKIIDPSWSTNSVSATQLDADMNGPDWQFADNQYFKIQALKLLPKGGNATDRFSYDDEIIIEIEYECLSSDASIAFIWKLFDMNDSLMIATSPMFSKDYVAPKHKLNSVIIEQLKFPAGFLNIGKYYLTMIASVDKTMIDTHHHLLSFEVVLDEWMENETWASIPAPILHAFEWHGRIK